MKMLYYVSIAIQSACIPAAWWSTAGMNLVGRVLLCSALSLMAHRRWLAYQAARETLGDQGFLNTADRLLVPCAISVTMLMGFILLSRKEAS